MSDAVKNRRMPELDIIRITAILMVILMHCVDKVFLFTAEEFSDVSKGAMLFAVITRSACRISVPLFVILSGYLMLDRDYEKEGTIPVFWKKKCLPLLICYFIWDAFYELFSVVVQGVRFDLPGALKRLFMLDNSLGGQLWYLPMILGLYFCIPFISIVVKRVPLKVMFLSVLAVYFVSYIAPTYNLIAGWLGFAALTAKLNTAFLGGKYVLLFVSGFYIKSEIIPFVHSKSKERFAVIISACIMLISYLITAVSQYVILAAGHSYKLEPFFFTMPVLSVSTFVFLMLVHEKMKDIKCLSKVSELVFGVFCVHVAVYKTILAFWKEELLSVFGRTGFVLLLFVISTTVSFALVYVVYRCIPKVSKVLFLTRAKGGNESGKC